MNATQPPQVPSEGCSRRRLRVLLISILVLGGIALISMRAFGLLRPFYVPTGAMTPAVSPGDHIFMEGITYHVKKPQRGDVVVFKTEGLGIPGDPTIFVSRIAGEPGDRLRITDGKLYVNDKAVPLKNRAGEIRYLNMPSSTYLSASKDTVTIPNNHYFVLSDNSGNAADGRYWGFLPRRNIIGRASLCYWPSERVGAIQ